MRRLTKFKLLAIQALVLLGVLHIYFLPIQSAPQGPWVLTDKGSKVWYEKPQLNETVTWSGSMDASGYAAGHGTLQWLQNGKPTNRYEGNMLNGKKSGKGIFVKNDGERYEGEFVDGKQSGKGILTWPGGNRYEGDFVDGKQTGKGILTWANGTRYEGDFVDGKRTGKGILTWDNGDRYEGDFVNDARHGFGIYTYHDGREISGKFENNEYQSQ